MSRNQLEATMRDLTLLHPTDPIGNDGLATSHATSGHLEVANTLVRNEGVSWDGLETTPDGSTLCT
jgi:hypothetical protein